MESNKILDGLNKEQKEAVVHNRGPLLIVAGAGTGKTTVITRRIAYLISTKKAQPSEILALTFTEKAAAEMEERVDLLVPYGYTDIFISTFHAFGDKVLRENAFSLKISPDFQVLSKAQQIIFLREHLFELPLDYFRPLADPTRHLEALTSYFSRLKDEDISPEQYLVFTEELSKSHPRVEEEAEKEYTVQHLELARTYQKYCELMTKFGKIDFGDQVYLTLKLFREHPLVLKKYQEKYKYILVDEFQDTNFAQFEMLKLLAAKYKNITVCGDDDQAIFRFRGAAIKNILNYADFYFDCKKVVLVKNYRSSQAILDASRKLILQNDPYRLETKINIDKRLKAVKEKENKLVKHLHFDSVETEADETAKIIKEKVESKNSKFSDFAVLVRSNKDADPFLRAFNMQNIPHLFSGGHGLYARPEIRLLIAVLKVIADPEDSLSLYFLAGSDIYQYQAQELLNFLNFAHKTNCSLYKILRENFQEKARQIVKDIANFIEIAQEKTTGEVLYLFLKEKKYLFSLIENENESSERKIRNIALFFKKIEEFSKTAVLDRAAIFVRYLDMLRDAGDDPSLNEVDFELDAVNVLTVHKAKGLEFPVVFLVSCVTDRFPVRNQKDAFEIPAQLIKDEEADFNFNLQEERRLFYVGMTRAMKELYFTSAFDYGGMRSKKISPFVVEALDKPPQVKEVVKTPAQRIIDRFTPTLFDIIKEKKKESLKNKILNLSFFQLDDYLTCSLKYKYVHILRVPIMTHHAIIYGKAIHDAVCAYNLAKKEGRKISLAKLFEVFSSSWRSLGFHSRSHEEERFRRGKEALKSFFKREGKSRIIPFYVEKDFSFVGNNIRFRGRFDRVDRIDGEIIIKDFKSSEIKKEEEAQKRAKESLQLSIYALASKEIFGKMPVGLELHFLESGLVGRTKRTEEDLEETQDLIAKTADGIRKEEFSAKPSYMACKYCAYTSDCPSTIVSR